jgi:hypothetical protein
MKWLPWTIAAICWIGIIVGSMYWFRSAVIGSFDEQAMRDWQADRAKLVEGQRDGTAPVTRRINPSEFPPAYVLMQDHFATCLAAAVGFGTLVMGALAIMIHGALNQPGRQEWSDDD